MKLSDSITNINSLLEENCTWLTTYRFASKAYVNDNIVYMIEKQDKERYAVMPSDVRTPISYFVMKSGTASPITGTNRSIQKYQKVSYNIRQIFIINIDDVDDEDVSYFNDKVEMCREKILDVYINKQINTGFRIDRIEEDLENVFSDVEFEDYNSMRFPYIYLSLDLNVVSEVDCI